MALYSETVHRWTRALSCNGAHGLCAAMHADIDGALVLALITLPLVVGCLELVGERLLSAARPGRTHTRGACACVGGGCAARSLVLTVGWLLLVPSRLPSGGQPVTVAARGPCSGVSFVHAPPEGAPSLPSVGVVSPFRNEEASMREWLENLHAEGVREFVLADDNSTDASRERIRDFRRSHADARVVVIERPAGMVENDVLRRAARHSRADWFGVFDLDEFPYARPPFATIPEYLAALPARVTTVWLPWKQFGSAGRVDRPPSIIGAYYCRGPNTATTLGKSFARRSAVRRVGQHVQYTKSGLCVNPDLSCCDLKGNGVVFANQDEMPLQLNHYQNMAFDVWERTKQRSGRGNGTMNRGWYTSVEIFYDRDERYTGVVDTELARKRGKYFATAAGRAFAPTEIEARRADAWVRAHCPPPREPPFALFRPHSTM